MNASTLSTIPALPSAQWGLIVGFLLSPLVAVVVSAHWPSQVKALVAFGIEALFAVGTVYWNGGLDLAHWQTTLLTIITTAMSAYVAHKSLWNPSGISPAIEAATTHTSQREA